MIFQHTNIFSLKRIQISCCKIHIGCIRIDVIFLFPHRHIGKKHIFSTFVCIGNATKNINLSIFQLCKAVFPITCYVFICPSCITCNILKILITIAASFSLFIGYIISFLKRSYPDNIVRVFFGRCRNG